MYHFSFDIILFKNKGIRNLLTKYDQYRWYMVFDIKATAVTILTFVVNYEKFLIFQLKTYFFQLIIDKQNYAFDRAPIPATWQRSKLICIMNF